MIYTGSCYCHELSYELDLASPNDARTSLCHCKNCKRFFGTAFGLTTKIPVSAFRYTSGNPKVHMADNGSGTQLTREFCGTCGSGILEFGEPARNDWRYVMTGTMDEPDALPPKGEFFCKNKSAWMPEIPGVFHKREIKD